MPIVDNRLKPSAFAVSVLKHAKGQGVVAIVPGGKPPVYSGLRPGKAP